MILSKIIIDNYRNFDAAEINLKNQTLFIGANDVGKTNLFKAIRLLLDKTLSQVQYDADDTDYCIFTKKEYIKIFLEFTITDELEDEFVIAKFGKNIKNNIFYLAYFTSKELSNNAIFYVGSAPDLDYMSEISRSFITQIINCVYLDSTRDLQLYLKKAKQKLIIDYKNNRSEDEILSDNEKILNINSSISTLNGEIEQVSYINKSTDFLKEEIKSMSSHNRNINLRLSSFSEFDDLAKNTSLISEVEGKAIEISGDGRRNQIFMSLWARENRISADEKKHFTLFLVEEPESHLHFPLQQQLSNICLNPRIKSFVLPTVHVLFWIFIQKTLLDYILIKKEFLLQTMDVLKI